MGAPALGLPDPRKPYELFVHERNGTALGVLTQSLGSWRRPVGYFSKQLDNVAKGWPPCLRAVAAVVILLAETNKLTLGQPIHVQTPHSVLSVLEQRGGHWLTSARLQSYQAQLLETPGVTLQTCNVLNPATLIPEEEGALEHDCQEVLDEVYSSRQGLSDIPLNNPDLVVFTDGSSFVEGGERRAGYAVVTLFETLEAEPMVPGTSAQAAELQALARALELSKDQRVNVYTDSKFAFCVLHVYGALWQHRGLLRTNGGGVKHAALILKLLQAVHEPKEVAVMHCRAHQRGDSEIHEGNRRADGEAKRAARKPYSEPQMALIPTLELPPDPQYRDSDQELLQNFPSLTEQNGWKITPEKKVIVPRHLIRAVLQPLHQSSHVGGQALHDLFVKYCVGVGSWAEAQRIAQACQLCQQNNPRIQRRPPATSLPNCAGPGQSWQIDFTELPPVAGVRYLLVMVDNFSRWVEAWGCRTNKAREVTRKLLHNVIPFHSIPLCISSDNGRHFIDSVVHEVSKALGIEWKLHTAYRPTASSRVERTNQSLKRHLAKICQETSLNWTDALPIALARVRATPHSRLGLSPFEILFGRPWHVGGGIGGGDMAVRGNEILKEYVKSLSIVLTSLHRHVREGQPVPVDFPLHPFQPGDTVWLRTWADRPLAEKWEGPHEVLLVTHTALKLNGVKAWVHFTRVKKANIETEQTHDANVPEPTEQPEIVTSDDIWTAETLPGLKVRLKKATLDTSSTNAEEPDNLPPLD